MLFSQCGEREWVVKFLLVGHVGEDEVAFVGLWGIFCGGGAWWFAQTLQVLWGKNVDIAAYVFLFEGAYEQPPEILEG
jgi:hypothetical protein